MQLSYTCVVVLNCESSLAIHDCLSSPKIVVACDLSILRKDVRVTPLFELDANIYNHEWTYYIGLYSLYKYPKLVNWMCIYCSAHGP